MGWFGHAAVCHRPRRLTGSLLAVAGAAVLAGCGEAASVETPPAAGADVAVAESASPSPESEDEVAVEVSGDVAPGITYFPISDDLGDFSVAHGDELVFMNDDRVMVVDPTTGSVVRTFSVAPGLRWLVADEGYAWITNFNGEDLYRLDLTSGELTTLSVGPHAVGISMDDDGHLWVGLHRESQVVRVDPSTREVVASAAVGDGTPRRSGPSFNVFAFGAVWSSVPFMDGIVRIDPATAAASGVAAAGVGHDWCVVCGKVVAVGEGTESPDDDGIWVVGDVGITRLDPRTLEVGARVELPAREDERAYEVHPAVTDDGVWVATMHGYVALLDPTDGSEVRRIQVTGLDGERATPIRSLAVLDGHLWTWARNPWALIRIDPALAR